MHALHTIAAAASHRTAGRTPGGTEPVWRIALMGLLLAVAWASVTAAQPLPVATPESVGMRSEGLEVLRQSMRDLVDKGKRSGVVWAVAKDGKLVQFEAFGQRDIDAGLPIETDTVFRLYSQSRAITAVAVLTLVDEGRLSLTDPVANHVPEIGSMQVIKELRQGVVVETEPQRTPMTVEHLFAYTSGLGYAYDWPASLGVDQRDILSLDGTLADMMTKLGTLPLLSQPGDRWIYGFHSEVLARIAEVVTGQPFDRFLRERVLDPLGMPDTGFWVQSGPADRLATLYTRAPTDDGDPDSAFSLTERAPTPSSTYTYPGPFFSGGGGLVSTVADYLRFAQMIANGGELDGVRILRSETIENMATDRLAVTATKVVGNGYTLNPPHLFAGYGWGLSIGVRLPDHIHTIPGSPGDLTWGGLANTTFFIDRTRGVVAVAMTQYVGDGADELPFRLRNGVYGALAP
mgnify:CR=1 FL=1